MENKELLSVTDISLEFNISRYKVWNWIRRDNRFPCPLQYVNNGTMPLFEKDKVEKFIQSHSK